MGKQSAAGGQGDGLGSGGAHWSCLSTCQVGGSCEKGLPPLQAKSTGGTGWRCQTITQPGPAHPAPAPRLPNPAALLGAHWGLG